MPQPWCIVVSNGKMVYGKINDLWLWKNLWYGYLTMVKSSVYHIPAALTTIFDIWRLFHHPNLNEQWSKPRLMLIEVTILTNINHICCRLSQSIKGIPINEPEFSKDDAGCTERSLPLTLEISMIGQSSPVILGTLW
jgi:hypothetical protein